MVQRSVDFFKNKGFYECSILFDEALSKTKCLTKADADFMSKKTLWKFSTQKEMKKNKDLIKLLIYYVLSKKTPNWEKSIYKDLDSIGIFNPRLNISIFWKIDDIDKELIKKIDLLIFK